MTTEEMAEDKSMERLDFRRTKTNVIEILKCTNATPIRCMTGIGYTCCFCPEKFSEPSDLKQHTLLEHDFGENCKMNNDLINKVSGEHISKLCVKLDITSLSCKLCSFSIDTIDDLFQHLISKHKRHLYTNVTNYILPFKFLTEKLTCSICCEEFMAFKTLIGHMNSHFSNYICDVCNAGYVNRDRLNKHKVIHEIGEFKCQYCPKILDTKNKKECHERNKHTHVNRMVNCGYCEEQFSNRWRKEIHHHEVHGIPLPERDNVSCSMCPKEFQFKSSLKAHMRRVHLMEKIYKCDYCEKEFFGLNEMKKHVITHTGKKDFQCGVCLKWYGRRNTLREHMRIHQDDRRFKCGHCGQAFVQKCSWRGHMRAKHGENV